MAINRSFPQQFDDLMVEVRQIANVLGRSVAEPVANPVAARSQRNRRIGGCSLMRTVAGCGLRNGNRAARLRGWSSR